MGFAAEVLSVRGVYRSAQDSQEAGRRRDANDAALKQDISYQFLKALNGMGICDTGN
jgi:hypothetical protein